MKPARVVGAVLVVVVTGAVAWFGYLRFGGASAVVTEYELAVFPSQQDAAYAGSESIKTAPAFATLKQGENVSLLWDTYGKDYWACYIRTPTKERGWVLCGFLQRST
jgi:hypothetical protein